MILFRAIRCAIKGHGPFTKIGHASSKCARCGRWPFYNEHATRRWAISVRDGGLPESDWQNRQPWKP